ncbi:MAG: M23 family metallopeptidase [Acidobacteria bacterium]|nr:M23 family metallopeptidase [Acidobacteriota bacterium]
MRTLLSIVVGVLIAAALVWFLAGRAAGPTIAVDAPAAVVGVRTPLKVDVFSPGGTLTDLDVSVEQNGQAQSIGTLAAPQGLALTPGADKVTVTGEIGRQSAPALQSGAATIVVRATRPVLFGLREVASTLRKDVQVRLTPPTLSVLSQFHFINQGGAEVVVYQVNPADVESGVRVGETEYAGLPASGAGIANAAPGLRVAFFPFTYDRTPNTPVALWARDEAGNTGQAGLDSRVNVKQFRRSTIPLDDAFLQKVVPAILQATPDLRVDDPNDLLASYLAINRELRRRNNETIRQIGVTKSAKEILWRGPFRQMMNSAVEAGFADDRTYVYQGKSVDRQTHLGFDLASTQHAPILAANRGVVVYAGYLGIYGNCVIVDHGMGLQTLYAHLSSIGVQEGQAVEMNAELGRSGQTGLAGGDHLHFTTVLHGEFVTPVDWWSAQWIEDRVMRKLRAAGAPAAASTPAGAP